MNGKPRTVNATSAEVLPKDSAEPIEVQPLQLQPLQLPQKPEAYKLHKAKAVQDQSTQAAQSQCHKTCHEDEQNARAAQGRN